MSSSFNLNTFLQEYKGYNNKSYTAAEIGKQAMEQHEIEQAQEAVKQDSFLYLTLSEKFAKLGIGNRVVQQLGDTAVNALKDTFVNPVTDYLKKYENIFDRDKYVEELQGYAKQLFFSQQSLSEDAGYGAKIVGLPIKNEKGELLTTATKFVYDM